MLSRYGFPTTMDEHLITRLYVNLHAGTEANSATVYASDFWTGILLKCTLSRVLAASLCPAQA